MPIFFIFTQGKTTHVTLYGMKVNKYYLFFMENLFIHICKPVFSPKLASFFFPRNFAYFCLFNYNI